MEALFADSGLTGTEDDEDLVRELDKLAIADAAEKDDYN